MPEGFMRRGTITALMLAGPVWVSLHAADADRLIDAVRARDSAQVQTLLRGGVNVNAKADDGSTPLLWAAHSDDVATASALVRAGADANAANQFGMTPLSRACTNGSAEMVELLLKAGATAGTAIGTGETPLMTCAATGATTAVKMLLARGAAVNATEPLQRQTALMWAAAERYADVAGVLIEAGANLSAATKKGFTALHFAARAGDIPTAARLIEAGADVNAVSVADGAEPGRGVAYQSTLSAGSTPLLVATVRGHVPLALYLLEHGADPNIGDAGFTPLHWASGTWEGGVSNPVYGFSDPMSGIPDRRARLRLIGALLARGANVNARMTKRPFIGGGYEDAAGATPFVLASAAADVEIMKMLLAAGADRTLTTDTGATAVMAASGLNRSVGESALTEAQVLAAVNLLFALGADARGQTTLGENALFGAAYRGWNTLLTLLIDKGANVNAVSKAGITPWLAASGYGDRLGGVLYNTDGANILLARGADPKLGKPCQAQVRCAPAK
jgi:ankyrin repeat protein